MLPQNIVGYFYALKREEILSLRQHNLIQGPAYLNFCLRFDMLLSPVEGLLINVKEFCDRWQMSESCYYKSLKKLRQCGIVQEFQKQAVVMVNFLGQPLDDRRKDVDDQRKAEGLPSIFCNKTGRETPIEVEKTTIEVENPTVEVEGLSVEVESCPYIEYKNKKINTQERVHAHTGAYTTNEEIIQVPKEVIQNNLNVIEVEVIENNSTTPKRSEAINNNSSLVQLDSSLGLRDSADENDYHSEMPENIKAIKDRFDSSQIAPKGIEFMTWVDYELGRVICLYRRSGRALNSNPNDIDRGFIQFMQKKAPKIANIHGWIRNMEKEPSRWGELEGFVQEWQKEKFLSSDEGKEAKKLYNQITGNRLFDLD